MMLYRLHNKRLLCQANRKLEVMRRSLQLLECLTRIENGIIKVCKFPGCTYDISRVTHFFVKKAR